jgi:peptidoglycan/LPS O-acetylase OafA/YrhL
LRPRLLFIDSLRILLITLVVMKHAGQAYGPTGGRWPIVDPERARVLGPFFAVNAAFFMGLFFLVSAYFLPGACDRKGPRAFLQDRGLRLGVPRLGGSHDGPRPHSEVRTIGRVANSA